MSIQTLPKDEYSKENAKDSLFSVSRNSNLPRKILSLYFRHFCAIFPSIRGFCGSASLRFAL